MPTPSNPSPRRSSGATRRAPRPDSARRGARSVDLSEAPKSASKPTDAGTKRRALKKRRSRQGNWAAWTLAGAITVVIAGAGAGIWAELGAVKARVAQKRATLSDLQSQLESGGRRLRALTSSSGKERVLVENGFIKPGERLLLFPKNAAKK